MKDWKSTLVGPETPILETLKIIDNSALQIALVVDGDGRLLGTVTDGDIRRAILKNIPLEQPVSRIMFSHPTTALAGVSREELLGVMKQKNLRHIPILDERGRIIELKMLLHLLGTHEQGNWVVIMAGGLGKRLQPLTYDRPKPLLEIGGKPILQTIIENFVEQGFRHFYISVHYKAEMIEDHFGDGSRFGVEILYLREDIPLGTAGALGLLRKRPDESFMVMNGDVLTKTNFRQLMNFHVDSGSRGTMCVREYHYQVPYGVIEVEDSRLSSIDEKPIQTFFVNAGIYVLEPDVLSLIPPGAYFDMTDLFNMLKERRMSISVFPIREYWLDIGQLEDFKRANGEFEVIFK
jgi:dTDP-glucose pyrophosphorylase